MIIYFIPNRPSIGHSPFGPHSISALQNLPLTQSIVGTIGSLHTHCIPLPLPFSKHHPPGQSSLFRQPFWWMHVPWGSINRQQQELRNHLIINF